MEGSVLGDLGLPLKQFWSFLTVGVFSYLHLLSGLMFHIKFETF
jgi:hypothetical protein